MSKRFWAVLIVILVIVIGIVWISNDKNANAPGGGNKPTSHIEGQGKKNVTLVEYGDYECPICEGYYPVVKQVVAQYNADIHFQFRNLPLYQIHQNAFAAARAAEAASLQGKFWQMHDALYDNQNTWVNSTNAQGYFQQYAQSIGLNLKQFNADYSSSKVNNSINADLSAFAKTGQAQATPTFFLDGKYISTTQLTDPSNNQPDANKFAQLINAEIAKKNPTKSTTDTTKKQ